MSFLFLLLLCAGAVALLLLVPLDLLVRAERCENLSSEITVSWLFGVIRKSFPLSREGAELHPHQGAPRAKKRKRRRHSRSRIIVAILRTPDFPGRVAGLAHDIIRSVRVRLLRVRARVGFENPAATGMACGIVASLSPLLQDSSLQVEWEPDFSREVFAGEAAGDLRVIPARILWVTGRFTLHPVSFRALQAALRERKG